MENTTTLSAEAEQEIELLSWVIDQARRQFAAAEAKAQAEGKVASLAPLRVILQAQSRRMALRGFGPLPRLSQKAKNNTADALLAQIAQMEAMLPTGPESKSPEPNTSTAAPKLNRAKRRALAQQEARAKKRKAA